MNDLPPIAPTGAMASGDYVDYMIGYDSLAEDVISDNLTEVSTTKIMEDWYKLWGRVLGEVSTRITAIETSLTTLNQQIRVIDSKVKSL